MNIFSRTNGEPLEVTKKGYNQVAMAPRLDGDIVQIMVSILFVSKKL